MWQSIGLTLLVIVATLVCVLLFMLCGFQNIPVICLFLWVMGAFTKFTWACGCNRKSTLTFLHCWYVVWQLFLSKFKFLRELIGDTGSQQEDNEITEPESGQDTSSVLLRSRQKSTRQRKAPTEEAT